LKIKLPTLTVTEFWIAVQKDYIEPSEKAISSQHPFAAMSAIFSSRYTEQTHAKRKYATRNETMFHELRKSI